jgi:CheY-like chemotaxis protein
MDAEEEQATILIVEDDLDLARLLEEFFCARNYQVIMVDWGQEGIRAASANQPDLIILDINLPDIDGFEVIERLSMDWKTNSIPVLFLTNKGDREDRLHGLELHASDYITKPVDFEELHLRVRNTLQRARATTLINPVTGIAEGILVDEAISDWIADHTAALFVVALRGLDDFREGYGFVASDDLLRAAGLMLRSLLANFSGEEWFLGHLSFTDFVLVGCINDREAFIRTVDERLKELFGYFCNEKDLEVSLAHDGKLRADIQEYNFPTAEGSISIEQLRVSLSNLYR